MTPTTEELKAALLHADYMEPINETLARSIRLLAQAELSRREKVRAAVCCRLPTVQPNFLENGLHLFADYLA
jgi:hypothetical protein